MVRIVVDAMGGDAGPTEVVAGCAQASLLRPDLAITLVGEETRLRELLAGLAHARDRVAVHAASQAVAMDEKPSEALARKPDSSIAVAARLVAEGQGEALVSAGNTGASVLACARNFKLLPGVRRAALAA